MPKFEYKALKLGAPLDADMPEARKPGIYLPCSQEQAKAVEVNKPAAVKLSGMVTGVRMNDDGSAEINIDLDESEIYPTEKRDTPQEEGPDEETKETFARYAEES